MKLPPSESALLLSENYKIKHSSLALLMLEHIVSPVEFNAYIHIYTTLTNFGMKYLLMCWLILM